jgi:hypothetical protein
MRAFIVPNGCSTVSRRCARSSGLHQGTASSRCSCSHRGIRRFDDALRSEKCHNGRQCNHQHRMDIVGTKPLMAAVAA